MQTITETQPCLSHDSVWTMADVFDVIVVGGGIVGCAVVWEMTSYGYKCLLLEKNENLVSEASSGNRFVPYTIGCFAHSLIKIKKERKMIAKDTQQQNKITGKQTFLRFNKKKYNVGAFEFG